MWKKFPIFALGFKTKKLYAFFKIWFVSLKSLVFSDKNTASQPTLVRKNIALKICNTGNKLIQTHLRNFKILSTFITFVTTGVAFVFTVAMTVSTVGATVDTVRAIVATVIATVITVTMPVSTVRATVDTVRATVDTVRATVATVGANVEAVFIGFLKNSMTNNSQACFAASNFDVK